MVTTSHKRTDRQPRWRGMLLGLALLGAHPLTADARSSDSQQPIEVEADSTEFDNQSQRHTLRGDVRIRQGSLSVNAERIVLQLADGRLVEIDAQGDPLTFSIEDERGEKVEARAKKLLYKPENASLSLLGSAKLISKGRELSGERIDYDIAGANVQALSGRDNRVKVVIEPEASSPPATGGAD